MYVSSLEVSKWQERLIPGQMFLLNNGSVYAVIGEGKDYPFYQIKVKADDLVYLKKQVTKGE